MSATKVFLYFINFHWSERIEAWFSKLAEKKTKPKLTAHSNSILTIDSIFTCRKAQHCSPLQSLSEERFTLWAAAWSWDSGLCRSNEGGIPSSRMFRRIEVEVRHISTSLNQILRIFLPSAKETYLLVETKEIPTQRKLTRTIYCSRIYYRP